MSDGDDSGNANQQALSFILLGVLWVAGLSGVGLPYFLHHKSSGAKDFKEILSIANAFGGGVFLGSSLLHMLPDTLAEDMSSYPDWMIKFPTKEFFVGCGFLAVLLIEKVLFGEHDDFVVALQGPSNDKLDNGKHQHQHLSDLRVDDSTGDGLTTISEQRVVMTSSVERDSALHGASDHDHGVGGEHLRAPLIPGDVVAAIGAPRSKETDVEGVKCIDHHHVAKDHVIRVKYYNRLFAKGMQAGITVASELNNACDTVEMSLPEAKPTTLQAYILLGALCFHSAIAGLTLGIMPDGPEVVILYIALIAHKFFAAFSLTISFIKAQIPFSVGKTSLLFFTTATPIGAMVGIMARSFVRSQALKVLEGTVVAFGCGTCLYISIMGAIAEELESRTNAGIKFTVICIGFVTMGALSMVS
eukprot:GFYU01015421.1.p1 GENE.GFYU01015421.1~~GFYU01015421.1.p1  ORF type:complete len:416 (+),score=88.45 GFYU01015421.1:210-1457(+)